MGRQYSKSHNEDAGGSPGPSHKPKTQTEHDSTRKRSAADALAMHGAHHRHAHQETHQDEDKPPHTQGAPMAEKELENPLTRLAAEAAQTQAEADALKKKLAELEARQKAQTAKLSDMQKDESGARAVIDDYNRRKSGFASAHSGLKKFADVEKGRLESTQGDVATRLKHAYGAEKTRIEKLKEDRDNKSGGRDDAQKVVQAESQKIQESQSLLENIKSSIKSLATTLDLLKAIQDRASKSTNPAERYILALQIEARLPEIRLDVDPQNDIETALRQMFIAKDGYHQAVGKAKEADEAFAQAQTLLSKESADFVDRLIAGAEEPGAR
jgi:hypothetical protein